MISAYFVRTWLSIPSVSYISNADETGAFPEKRKFHKSVMGVECRLPGKDAIPKSFALRPHCKIRRALFLWGCKESLFWPVRADLDPSLEFESLVEVG